MRARGQPAQQASREAAASEQRAGGSGSWRGTGGGGSPAVAETFGGAPPTYQPGPTPMGTQLQAPQLVGISGASAEPRGSQLLPLRVCGALIGPPTWHEGWERFAWEAAPYHPHAAAVAAAADRGEQWADAMAADDAEDYTLGYTPHSDAAPSSPARADASAHASHAAAEAAVGFGASVPPPPSSTERAASAFATMSGKELIKRVYTLAISMAEWRTPKAAAAGITGGSAAAAAAHTGSAAQPLIRHAVGKPAGCLCLELCETSAHVALRATLARLSRLAVAETDDNTAHVVHVISQLLPLLTELRRRLATARQALMRLVTTLPPAPPGAAPVGAVSVAKALLAMSADGSRHPGAEAARAAAPQVTSARERPRGEPPEPLATPLPSPLPLPCPCHPLCPCPALAIPSPLALALAVPSPLALPLPSPLPLPLPSPLPLPLPSPLPLPLPLPSPPPLPCPYHPLSPCPRHPQVTSALDAWHEAGIADALGTVATDLSVHAHTLAGHIRRALPAAQGSDLLQGISQMPPPVAISHLCSPHRLERLRRIAAWGAEWPTSLSTLRPLPPPPSALPLALPPPPPTHVRR